MKALTQTKIRYQLKQGPGSNWKGSKIFEAEPSFGEMIRFWINYNCFKASPLKTKEQDYYIKPMHTNSLIFFIKPFNSHSAIGAVKLNIVDDMFFYIKKKDYIQ